MNNFTEVLQLVKKRKDQINSLYEIVDKDNIGSYFESLISLSGLKKEKNTILAILRRLVDLKEENLVKELEKNNFSEEKIIQIKHLFYNEVRKFYEREHQELIDEIKSKKLLNDFYQTLIQGVHDIGLIMNDFESSWTKEIIEKNNKILSSMFKDLDLALDFLKQNKLYQVDREGKICERSYGVLVRIGQIWRFVPYAKFFENEILRLEFAFDSMIDKLKKIANTNEEFAYIKYLVKLKAAFCERQEDKVIEAWQEAELAWMEVKSPLQIGHPLEYYEDNYTHAVALEWDIRLQDESCFDVAKFINQINTSFEKICKNIDLDNDSLKTEVFNNINKTQLYICTPMIFYGAELRGLFSAQVVPNDEFVSAKLGKKIFAFLNFVYESAKSKPFMKLSNIIFNKEFLDYGREILFFKEEVWKRVYEISTIGHEFGHIFFIDQESEKLMNQSGYFKNIEEYKATTGGLVNFFYHEVDELRMPVFHELIKRAISLIAWQKTEEVKPYYTEGLIHLDLLFRSRVLSFKNKKLSINFTLEFYERFKNLTLQNYYNLAKHYTEKKDAKEFLNLFCTLENGIFLPINEECRDFVLYYYDLYEQIGNELDDSKEFEKYKEKEKKIKKDKEK
ncbi:invasion antigen B [Campylobacter novaezeelandiae]|uniref:invasion protein CiaB n=1 Tax=Campylobacter novaezeelandiae TaxID=2267891 RepID=UPI001C1E1E59|nr:invasion protein CiaB [Campylobacter novaezeelandiae]QWU79978.1 invasion antigen B [Campylobacter novaezeelandiae]